MSQRECADDEVADWARAHGALVQLARERRELEGREGRALLRAMRARVHLHLGCGSFGEYVERLFGYSPRTTFDKLRTAEALEALPELDRALTTGELTWSAARELARVATAETEEDWLAAAKGRTVRDVERLVAGHERGDRPSDAARPNAVRHALRFEVAAETLATFRHAMDELRRQSGEHLDDDTALLLMARHVLGRRELLNDRAVDAGRASYQLALTLCEGCQRCFQDASGERIEVDAAIVDMARCDAQHIGRVGVMVVSPEWEAPSADFTCSGFGRLNSISRSSALRISDSARRDSACGAVGCSAFGSSFRWDPRGCTRHASPPPRHANHPPCAPPSRPLPRPEPLRRPRVQAHDLRRPASHRASRRRWPA